MRTTNCLLFLVVLLLGLAADLITKSWAFARYYAPHSDYQPVVWWIDGVLGLQTSTNPGALFGMGAGLYWLFSAVSIVFLLIIVIWLTRFGATNDRWLSITLGLISSGILGNLYDRLGFGYVAGRSAEITHHVRDWILFRWEGIGFLDPWPNFNIADSCLVMGACLLFMHGLFYGKSMSSEPLDQPIAEQING